jgi:hypothetical protein
MVMKYKKILVILMPFVLCPVVYFVGVFTVNNFALPPCIIYSLLHIYCPGCGMTRSVIALLKGDILLSLRENVLILMLIVIVLLLYIEYVLNAFGVKCRLTFRNKYALYGALAFLLVFTVLRNFIPVIAPL